MFFLWASRLFGAEYDFKTIAVPQAVMTFAYGINDLGDVVGVSADDYYGYTAKPFLFSDGQYSELGVAGARTMAAFGINKHGVIVGILSGATLGQHGFIMDEANTTLLDGRADSVNNNPDTVLVGYRATEKFGQAAYLWRAGNYLNLVNPDLPGILGSAATGINDKGDVVGYWFTDNGACCLKTQGWVIKAGNLAFTGDLIPLGINSDGLIVGLAGAGNDGAILENGVVTLIKYPGADYTQIHGINNKGVLVGYYLKAGQNYGFVATPLKAAAAKVKR
jgi:probable HAF family extracellular repeat protein